MTMVRQTRVSSQCKQGLWDISKVHMGHLSGYVGWRQLAGAACNYVRSRANRPLKSSLS